MKKALLLLAVAFASAASMNAQPGGGTGGGGSTGGSSSSVAYSNGATLVITKAGSSYSGETYSQTGSDYNVVKDTCVTATLSNCTLTKTGATSSSGDNSSFYGINAAVYCSSTGNLTLNDCKVTTNADGANAFFCYNGGTLNLYRDTCTNSATRSRGLHCTGGNGATINAYDCYVVTKKETSSTIATDRGGGTVYVHGGYYEANGAKCAIVYSTGDMTVVGITGYSNNSNEGEIADIEGDNSITIDSCTMTCSGTSRGVMLYQSGSGDASGYNPVMNISNSTLTLTSSEAAFCEVPTAVDAYLTLDNCTLTVPSGVLAYVNTNSNWDNENEKELFLTLKNGKYEGALNHDETGNITVTVDTDTYWTGTINSANNTNTAADTVVVNGTWIMDGASYPDVLIINKGGKVYTNGYTLDYTTLDNNGTLNTTSTNVTRIEDVIATEGEENGKIYNLNGVEVNEENLGKGVYIKNGKKVIHL
ncbi:MAG: hypothetical protein ACOYJF_02780 [Prevotella sp.]|jgi:hypothetical protein